VLVSQNLPRNRCRILIGVQHSAPDVSSAMSITLMSPSATRSVLDPVMALGNAPRIKTVLA
jgi:hypothetical protein